MRLLHTLRYHFRSNQYRYSLIFRPLYDTLRKQREKKNDRLIYIYT